MSSETGQVVPLSLDVGFDQNRYRRCSENNWFGVDAFTVVTSLSVGNTSFTLPYSNGMTDLDRRYQFGIPADFAERLEATVDESLHEFGTVAMDCEAFARMVAPTGAQNVYREMGSREKPHAGSIIRLIGNSSDARGDHWVVGLGEKSRVLHVAGISGRLMVSSLRSVRKMYPRRTELELQ